MMTPDEFMDRVLDKLDRLDERLDSMSNTQVRQAASLDEHMRRTEILENEMKPIKNHVALTSAVAKIVAAVGALLSLALGIKTLIG